MESWNRTQLLTSLMLQTMPKALNQEQLAQLRALIESEHLDAILLFSSRTDSRLSLWLANIICPSAFHYLIVTKDQEYFAEVSYRANALSRITELEVKTFPDEDLIDVFLGEHLKSFNRVAVAGDIPFHHLKNCKMEIVDLHATIISLLALKSSQAVEGIRSAVECLSASLSLLRADLQPGWNAKQIARRFTTYLLDFDATLAFNTSVAIGEELKESTIAIPSEKAIWKEGCPLLIDCGAKLGGYYTDVTRMFFVEEASKLKDHYQQLCQAQMKTASSLQAGMSLRELYINISKEIAAEGLVSDTLEYADLGHGIGYALHEEPMFYREQDASLQLQVGNVITLEPEVIVDAYRIRVEDMYLICEDSVECLTNFCR